MAFAGRLRWVWRHPAIKDVTIMAGVVSAVAAGIRAPMLIGAGPIVVVTAGVAWRHRRRAADDAAPSAVG